MPIDPLEAAYNFTDDPVDRLRHTLAAHASRADGDWAVQATYNLSAPGLETGMTWGDLRTILARLEARP